MADDEPTIPLPLSLAEFVYSRMTTAPECRTRHDHDELARLRTYLAGIPIFSRRHE